MQAVQAYLQANFPDQRLPGLNEPAPPDATGVYLDIHSYSELVLWSWGFTATPAPNATALTTLGRKFAYFNGYYPEQSIGLYPTDGTTDDFGYGDLGVAAYTFELGTEFFQSCGFFESNILPGNLPALRYAAKVARTPYMTPAGPDAVAVAAVPGVIAPGEPVDVIATLDETRYSSANGAEPVQPIAAAELYLATPPWAGGTPVAMSADDGAFNETVEAATATLDGAATAALASGRHLVYVRGRDNLNNWGAVSAAFLTVIDPATAPIVSGTVTEAGTGTPLAATVAVGPFATATDPGTGAYSIQVPEGTYDIAASAPGHATVTAAGVALASQQTWVQDFVLQAYAIVLDDDVEGGNIGWSTGSPAWSITTSSAHSPTHSWTDSVGNYIDNIEHLAHLAAARPHRRGGDPALVLAALRHRGDLRLLPCRGVGEQRHHLDRGRGLRRQSADLAAGDARRAAARRRGAGQGPLPAHHRRLDRSRRLVRGRHRARLAAAAGAAGHDRCRGRLGHGDEQSAGNLLPERLLRELRLWHAGAPLRRARGGLGVHRLDGRLHRRGQLQPDDERRPRGDRDLRARRPDAVPRRLRERRYAAVVLGRTLNPRRDRVATLESPQ